MRDVKEPEIRRAEIMDAAVQLFTIKGYLNTTTQDIIDKVQISRGLLYYHFKNKEDILYCIINRYSEPLLKQLESLAYDAAKSAPEKIKAFVSLTLVPDKDITVENSVLQEAVNLEENRYMLDRFYHRLCERMIGYFAHILEQGNEEGVFQVEKPKEMAAFLMTGYIFVSNDVKIAKQDKRQLESYLEAYKILLERVLNSKMPLFF